MAIYSRSRESQEYRSREGVSAAGSVQCERVCACARECVCARARECVCACASAQIKATNESIVVHV